MSRSIEQNLLSLMPTHGSQLPPRLVDTARTLLTQSRQRASTLKADEEVARMLKITLDLPPIEPRPPIPPRVYKRLYTHLDNILPGKQVRGTPSSSRVKQALPSSPALGSAIKSVESRGLDRSVSQSARKAAAADITLVDTPTKSTSRGFVKSIQPDIGLHPWVRGVLAVLVAEFRKEEYGKFVLAGIEYVIAPGSRRTRDKWVLSHLPATVAGIFVVSMNRLETILGIEESEVDSLFILMEKTLDIMDHARENLDVKGLGSNEFWAGWTTPTVGDVEAAIKRATSGWVDADWYAALEDVALERAQPSKGGAKDGDGRKGEANTGIHKADTMHQPRYDYLGEKQQQDHRAWLKSLASRLAEQTDGDTEALEKMFGVYSET